MVLIKRLWYLWFVNTRRPGRAFGSGLPMGSPFCNIPGKFLGTPSGGMFPFTNSAGGAPTPAAAGGSSWAFESGAFTLDASASESRTLDVQFSNFSTPLTAELRYHFTPADFRDNDGGSGNMGVLVSSEEKGFGFELQGSDPSTFYVNVYSSYVPGAPGTVDAINHSYRTTWPPGTPVVRMTLGQDLVPHLYFDGVEAVLEDLGETPQNLQSRNYATAYAFANAPARFVTFDQIRIAGA